MGPVVEPGAAAVAVVEVEAQRPDQPEPRPGRDARPADRAGVGGDLGLEEDDVEPGPPDRGRRLGRAGLGSSAEWSGRRPPAAVADEPDVSARTCWRRFGFDVWKIPSDLPGRPRRRDVGVLDVDVLLGEPLQDPGERARAVVHLDGQDLASTRISVPSEVRTLRVGSRSSVTNRRTLRPLVSMTRRARMSIFSWARAEQILASRPGLFSR